VSQSLALLRPLKQFLDSAYPNLPIAAQNAACTLAGYSRFQSRFGPHFHRSLSSLEASAKWPRSRLLEFQRKRLDDLVERARRHVPHYRELGPASPSADPERALTETLNAIPPLDKETYRAHPENFLARDVAKNQLFAGQTSGTTGTALPLWFTAETLAEEYATVWRLRRACGVVGPRDASLTFNGNLVVPFGQKHPPFWRHSAYDRRTLFSVFHMSPDRLDDYVDAIHARQIRYVEGYPSAIHLLARAMLDSGRPLPRGRIAGIFPSSESLLAFQRETIEEAFGAPVRDRYGVSEMSVSMTGCEAKRLHVDMEFGIVEVEAQESNSRCERGPLLVTGLANDATAFLRYRVGDVGTRALDPCPCGRAGDSFLDVDGRMEDYILTPDGRPVGRLDHIFKKQSDVGEAQILQTSAHAIEVHIVPRPSYSERSQKELLREIRSRLGDEIEICIRQVMEIPREPNGKFRAVISSLEQGNIQ